MRGIRIGSVSSIPIKLHWSFLIVLPLFGALIAFDVETIATLLKQELGASITPGDIARGNTPWIVGFTSAIGLFVGVLLHELGHSAVAKRFGYEIDSITLWLLGGVASFTEFPENWRHELLIAVAGPIVSVVIGIGCYIVFLLLGPGMQAAQLVMGYLAVLNVMLAIFNLLPAFPMDGGRILRALLARSRPHAKATQQAAEVGKFFAFLLGIIGIFTDWFLILLAFFIYIAASGEAQQTSLRASFEGVSVSDIMTPRSDLKTVPEDISITELMDRMFEDRHMGYPVVRNEQLVGVVTLSDAAEINEIEQDAYRVSEVMTRDVESTRPKTDAMAAFEQMQSTGVGRLPVVAEDGTLIGIISRTDLMRAFTIIKSGGEPPSMSNPTRP
ncbi:CBS domain-containing protein [Halocatena halophila]|uniref:CBS domain-containing protein n=1 Tax=Halocatena halophila TaxID=2814576 RepID=UPI002ED68463